MTDPKIVRTDNEIAIAEDGQKVAWVTMPDPNADPMITAANTREASPKPSYGPHKANERYLDDEDLEQVNDLVTLGLAATLTGVKWYSDGTATPIEKPTVETTLQALETLHTHLRKKYYGG